MNKEELLIEYGHLAWDELPTKVREQIGDCQDTKHWFEQVSWMQKALRATQHGQPSEQVEGRIQHRVETRIATLDRDAYERKDNASWLARNWPSLAFATAGVAVGLFALQLAFNPGESETPGDKLATTEEPGGVQPIATGPGIIEAGSDIIEAGLPVNRQLDQGVIEIATNFSPRTRENLTLPAGNP